MELAYRVDGPPGGPALLLVNSIGTDLRMWEPQVVAFSDRYRVVRYDYPGHGDSRRPSGAQTVAGLAGHALSLLDQLRIERTHVCGISLGGMVAMELAARHAHRVDRAVFAATAPRIGTEDLWGARISAALMGGMHVIRAGTIDRFLSARTRARHPERVAALREIMETASAEGYAAACTALRDADLEGMLAEIHVPSLVIAGARDESTPLDQLERLQASIGGSELSVLDAAHLVNVEQPDEFNERVLRFLRHRPTE